MTRTTIRIGAAALGMLLGMVACHNDQLFRPYPNGPLDPLFARYVSMGNSITAGFQSGGFTQTQMMMKVDPTFVTVWLGNNDVLGAVIDTANAGNPAKITDTTLFKAQYGAVLDSIALTGARGGVLIGVANVTLIPFLTRGSKFYNVKFGSGANDSIPGADPANRKFPANFLVNPNCAPPRGTPF